MPHLVAAPDKFRGTASARDIAGAVERAALAAGWTCAPLPMADGGEGTLDALGGSRRVTRVRGPLGHEVDAEWRLVRSEDGLTAVIEMARASGLELVGGPKGNDPVAASTAGTGQLIVAAIAAGARRVLVGCGGSATTDGGLGAVEALGGLGARSSARLAGVELVVACDVTTRFVDAAPIFAPQKGATPAQVALLERRLLRLAERYADERGVEVRDLPGSGAAGGLAGGLAALGATLVPGFDVVADATGLAPALAEAQLVVTGEGHLDAQSLEGKVVGGVTALATAAGVPALVVVGDGDRGVGAGLSTSGATAVYLVDEVGVERAFADPVGAVERVVADRLAGFARVPGSRDPSPDGNGEPGPQAPRRRR
ncbi:MAG: glycerate kinase [Acidimicrobiales bacterium]|nr:glycerate kinase [Acidimicrobiales bacterium]